MSREEIIRMAREAGAKMTRPLAPHEFSIHAYTFMEIDLIGFASLVAAAERERCAKEVESLFDPKWLKEKAAAKDCAAAIRAL